MPEAGRWLDAHITWTTPTAPRVLVSSARRAQETWALASIELADRWGTADVRSEPRIYEAPASRLAGLIAETSDEVAILVVVGHNPGLADLIDWLGEPSDEDAVERFPTSAIAVLSSDEPWAVAVERSGGFGLEAFAIPRG